MKTLGKETEAEDAYDRVMSELEDYSGSAYGGVTETIFALFEQFYRKVRMLALPVSGFSLVIGFCFYYWCGGTSCCFAGFF